MLPGGRKEVGLVVLCNDGAGPVEDVGGVEIPLHPFVLVRRKIVMKISCIQMDMRLGEVNYNFEIAARRSAVGIST